jgi:hypothetical protein
MPSAISTPTFQALAGNIKNNSDSSAVYSAGAWDLRNASGTTTFAVSSAGVTTQVTATATTSVVTPLIKAYDGNGIKFQENGGTEVMSISDAGAVTMGPAVSTQTNRINGYVAGNYNNTGNAYFVANTADGSDSSATFLCGAGDAGAGRGGYIGLYGNEHATLAGQVRFLSATAATGTAFSFISNGGGTVATCTDAGAWTFLVSVSVTGTADVSGTTAALRTDGGCYVAKIMSAGTVTDRTPFPKDLQTAIDAINSMEKLPEGEYDESDKEKQLDHSKLHEYVKSGDHRDMSASVSCLVLVCQDLLKRLQVAEERIAILEGKA